MRCTSHLVENSFQIYGAYRTMLIEFGVNYVKSKFIGDLSQMSEAYPHSMI